ncbi:pq loop repeat protein [Grosmannia clavigera kw1407]|uniref:Pq loop repeat protein n=1 Tax=Grosmannia clavigera (strain kw1407 / UAMH 11150) TaxID=655863 RepID=F0XUM3_GROCL|nr:pq loop repeat protein [Grosmannia clavigera kw1407]EFW98697.1 pq loop repeat protein [Grosmannia clavigera kw1407]
MAPQSGTTVPQMFMAFCLVSWAQVLYYGSKWPVWKAVAAYILTAGIFAGVEAALILTLRPIYDRGDEAPALVVGILASILLAAGLLPPYAELWKRRGRVVGINWIVAQNSFDILGGVLYIVCACLEIGIFISHIIWRIRTRAIRKQAKADGKTFDDILAEHRAAGTPFAFAERESDDWLSPSALLRRMLGRKPKVGGDEEKCTGCESGGEGQQEASNEKGPSDGERTEGTAHQLA